VRERERERERERQRQRQKKEGKKENRIWLFEVKVPKSLWRRKTRKPLFLKLKSEIFALCRRNLISQTIEKLV
jgi:hypothetical protein